MRNSAQSTASSRQCEALVTCTYREAGKVFSACSSPKVMRYTRLPNVRSLDSRRLLTMTLELGMVAMKRPCVRVEAAVFSTSCLPMQRNPLRTPGSSRRLMLRIVRRARSSVSKL
eukprot:scaffold1261_cov377-Prasinococcus_capsulatus_cf.AAC.15